jgi:hypothetical protein
MAKFESKNGELFIDGKRVIEAFESWSGWYWFATKILQTQNTQIGDKLFKDDKIYYGFVQGLEEEWGDFSEAELTEMMKTGRVWKIPKKNWSYSGRRGA